MDTGGLTDVVALLARRYDEPHRHYHSRHHVEEMLAALVALTGEPLHPALELAAWAHDVVYDPRAGDGANERASAALLREVGTGVAPAVLDEAEALTLATITHTPPTGLDPEAAERARAFLDADLWILASPPVRFAEYEHQVRAEYAFVPDEVFVTARAAVLAGFAERKRIYLTDLAHREWEPNARRNLSGGHQVRGRESRCPTREARLKFG